VKRMLKVLTVALLVVALLVVTVAPAFAAPPSPKDNSGSYTWGGPDKKQHKVLGNGDVVINKKKKIDEHGEESQSLRALALFLCLRGFREAPVPEAGFREPYTPEA
jgi:hypothetical protein